MTLTETQKKAIAARGNVLVVAGAGTGKTSTLVERCLDCLLREQPPVSLDQILMVTFTDAAAAEMRQRIRLRLEAIQKQHPNDLRWHEQLALFETAHIGTLHSFCLEIVRQHFYVLDLDPQLSVLPAEEARLLADETLESLLQQHYSGQSPDSQAVQQLIQAQARGSDHPIRALVLRLHHYTQTLPNPGDWFRNQFEYFASPEPIRWREWLLDAIAEWRDRWRPKLQRLRSQNKIAEECLALLASLKVKPSRAEAAAALEQILAACDNCPHRNTGQWLDPLQKFLAELDFLIACVRIKGTGTIEIDPLAEDWAWVRSQMTTLLKLARQFEQSFTQTKRESGVVDFHDLEQYALHLLWNANASQPTAIALQWRKKLRFVFVDEYQDINAAQDKIIEALGRDAAQANRFLVGDIKQSIYRFRLANPRIFQDYVKTWGNGQGAAIPLVENFRSREGILGFVNSLFELIMQPQIGGVTYDESARLVFGAPAERQALSLAQGSGPRVELQLRIKSSPNHHDQEDEASDAAISLAAMEEADKEACLVGLRLRELRAAQHQIWDEDKKTFRSAEWSDMAILLRAPSNKAESYARQFSRLNIPLLVARGGFYESIEISDLLSLLQLLDNPLQDLPALAVLRSPLVGLTLNELAAIRLAAPGHFWTALVLWHEQATRNTQEETRHTYQKVSLFLDRFALWRRLARRLSLSGCLDTILAETHYADWLRTQPRGEQGHANLQRLVGLARQFDQFHRHSLFRFLRFIEAQKTAESEPEVPPVTDQNAVRLMSIHQSKGQEFPVVIVADLGKPFNLSDLRAQIILDEKYGLCPQIKPPHTGKRYPSLPFWMARLRQQRELLGEELRLLYVAMTRARDTLILSGTVTNSKFERLWKQNAQADADVLLSATSCADWLGLWFSKNVPAADQLATQGETRDLRWTIHEDDSQCIRTALENIPANNEPPREADAAFWEKLQERLAWQYPFAAATTQPAKTTVSAVRRRAAEDLDDPSTPLFDAHVSRFAFHVSRSTPTRPSTVSATDVGSAHHAFLQRLSLDHVQSVASLRAEAKRLEQTGALTPDEVGILDFEGLAAFWTSDLGRKIRAHSEYVQRELAFTLRCSPAELASVGRVTPCAPEVNSVGRVTPCAPIADAQLELSFEHEFVILQGAADLAVILPHEIWLVDFKTDAVKANDLADKVSLYQPQLKLYAQALSRIYDRPVSQACLYFLASRTAVPIQQQRVAPAH